MDSLNLSEEIKQLKRLRASFQNILNRNLIPKNWRYRFACMETAPIIHDRGEFYEYQLKLVGIEMDDLGDEINNLLDESVDLQRVTNLQDLRQSNLQIYYYKKKKEHLDYQAIVAQLKKETTKQQQELENEQTELNLLEKFTASINKRLVSEAQMQSSKLDIESSMKSLQDHLDALEIPDDFNIDELIRKVEFLKNERYKEKKDF